jgi:hypothetical protein
VRQTIALTTVGLLAIAGVGSAASFASATGGDNGHARAVAEAKAVLADAPSLAAAVPSTSAPVKRLASSPGGTAYLRVVERAKWWTVDESAKQAFADLTAAAPAGYIDAGGGSASSGPKPRQRVVFETYEPNSLPHGIAYAGLSIAVTSTGKDSSAIGAYAQAVAQPPRPASENVPPGVHKATVSEVRSYKDKHPIQRTITGNRATRLVAAFDQLQVAPPSRPTPCPYYNGRTESASFSAHGNTWVATIGVCSEIAVVRDGKALPSLDDSATFDRRLQWALHPHHAHRSLTEHVPHTVKSAYLAHRNEPTKRPTRHRTVTGHPASTLAIAFDALRAEPRDTVQCDIAGGPSDTVTFRTAKHTWVARQSACTEVVVTRDGNSLPTLIATTKWEHDLEHYLGS